MMARLTNQEMDVIRDYAANDMNMATTAKKFFISRTGLNYQFNKIEWKTGLDPRKFYDLVELLSAEAKTILMEV